MSDLNNALVMIASFQSQLLEDGFSTICNDAAAATQQRSLPEQIVGVEVGEEVLMGGQVVVEEMAVVELTAEGSLTADYCCFHPG